MKLAILSAAFMLLVGTAFGQVCDSASVPPPQKQADETAAEPDTAF
jgi:hypothetical protein